MILMRLDDVRCREFHVLDGGVCHVLSEEEGDVVLEQSVDGERILVDAHIFEPGSKVCLLHVVDER